MKVAKKQQFKHTFHADKIQMFFFLSVCNRNNCLASEMEQENDCQFLIWNQKLVEPKTNTSEFRLLCRDKRFMHSTAKLAKNIVFRLILASFASCDRA